MSKPTRMTQMPTRPSDMDGPREAHPAPTLHPLPPKTASQIVFKVQSGVPLPTKTTRAAIYPWPEMLDGDSFFVASVDDERKQVQRRLYVSGRAWCKRHRPTGKIVTEIGKQGVTVWMVDNS